jgi:predicted porin
MVMIRKYIKCAFLLVGVMLSIPSNADIGEQTSVTLYGIVDAGVEYVNNVPNATGNPSNVIRVSSGNSYGSRFGFRGEETLGGNLKAIFALEGQFNTDVGTLANGGRIFGRHAYVGLEGPLGSITFGRHKNVISDTFISYDPMFLATYSLLTHDKVITVGRADNSMKYIGRFGKLKVVGLYSLGYDSTIPNGSEVPGARKVGREFGAGAEYGAGPMNFIIASDQLHGTSISTQDDKEQRVAVGAKYTAGPAKAILGYRWFKGQSGSQNTRSDLFWVGGNYQITPQIYISGGVYHTDLKDSDKDPTSYAASVSYNFSKRTAAYANLSYAKNKAGSNLGVAGFGSGIVAGENQTGVVIGMRHAF